MPKAKPWLIGLGIIALVVGVVVFYFLPALMKIAALTLILSALFITVDKFGFNWVLINLAEGDKWWSPYRMKPDAGEINIMTWGLHKPGPFAMVLAGHIPRWHFHEIDRRFYFEGNTTKEKRLFAKKFPGGAPPELPDEVKVIWVGFFKRYYRRARTWLAMDTKGEKHKIVEKKTTPENDHIFYFSTAMAQKIKQISKMKGKSKAPVPVTLDVSYNALLISPELAEFTAGKWEEKVVGAVDSRARVHIGKKTVDELREEKDGPKRDDFVDDIIKANYKSGSSTVGLIDHFGVQIEGLFFEDFQLEEGDADIFNAQKKVTIAALAVQEADQIILSEEKLGTASKKRALEEAVGIKAKARAKVEGYADQPLVAIAAEGNINTLVWGDKATAIAVPPSPPAAPAASTP